MELYAGFVRFCLNDEFNAKPLQEKFSFKNINLIFFLTFQKKSYIILYFFKNLKN